MIGHVIYIGTTLVTYTRIIILYIQTFCVYVSSDCLGIIASVYILLN